MRKELEQRLELKVHREQKLGSVYVIKSIKSVTPRLRPSKETDHNLNVTDGQLHATGFDVQGLADVIQNMIGLPVVDETGLAGRYDYTFSWRDRTAASITAGLRKDLGLEMQPAERSQEYLVVDHAAKSLSLSVMAGLSTLFSSHE